MKSVEEYVNFKENSKSRLEQHMRYIAERNAELERIIREAEEAEKELKKNRKRMMELTLEYVNLKGDM